MRDSGKLDGHAGNCIELLSQPLILHCLELGLHKRNNIHMREIDGHAGNCIELLSLPIASLQLGLHAGNYIHMRETR